jgi:His/Glu/Gln/Arg/opine family amino acid ABC transporter permease subunit
MTGRIELPDIPELELAPEKPPQGPVVWAKENLFSTPGSVVLTFFGLLVAWLFTRGIVGFILDYDSRRWDAVTVNARLLMAQAYPAGDNPNIVDASGVPIDQFHRVWISVGIVVVLAALSLVFWRVGGRTSVRKIARIFQGIGSGILFVFLGVPLIDYIFGILTSLDFGGFAWQFSSRVHLVAIAIGVALFAMAWLLERGFGEQAKEQLIPTMGLIGGVIVVIVGLLWIIELPVPASAEPGAPKVFAPIAESTTWPWTWLAVAGIVAFGVGLVLRRVIPERVGRRILTGLWLLSFPVITMVVLRDPAWGEEFAEGFQLSDYLILGVLFIVIGGALIWVASHPQIGEWSAAIAGVLVVAGIYSWTTSMLMYIRFGIIATLLFVLGAKTFGGSDAARRRYLAIWVGFMVLFTLFIIIAKGGTTVETPGESPFGGLILTFVVFVAVMVISFPIGVILALGRTSTMPIFRLLSVGYIEIVRSVPLITWLFMSVIFLPFALPLGTEIDGIITVILFYAGFNAAYLAENVRGGLQAIRGGQKEASKALGMTAIQTIIFITMPQALRTVIPALVGQAIAVFKDTSLVTIIGLFDFLHISRFVVPNQTRFLGSTRTTLVVAAAVYWVFTFAMSRASLRLEKKLGVGER